VKTPAIGTRELYKQLQVLIDTDTPVFIHGSPGIGKSYIVNDIAQKNSLNIIDVRLSQLDAVDLRGVPTIKDGRTEWMAPIFLPRDSTGILFLDELNSASTSVQSAIYQLILDRKIGEYSLPEGWRIVCAGNRLDDKAIVFRLPSPLVNRMVHLILEPNFEDFKIWAIENSLHSTIIGFLGFRPDLLSSEVPSASETNPAFPSPRSWTMLSKILQKGINQIEPIVYGTLGYATAIEYLSFVEIYKSLPDIDAILNGESFEVLQEPSQLYALTSAIIQRYKSENGRNILNYSKKLPTEFAVMLIKDLIIKDESISELEEFDLWIEEYGNYIL
jgi:hypothetical protein